MVKSLYELLVDAKLAGHKIKDQAEMEPFDPHTYIFRSNEQAAAIALEVIKDYLLSQDATPIRDMTEIPARCGVCGGTKENPGTQTDDSYSTFKCPEPFHRA